MTMYVYKKVYTRTPDLHILILKFVCTDAEIIVSAEVHTNQFCLLN
jgi:hypothetical protein